MKLEGLVKLFRQNQLKLIKKLKVNQWKNTQNVVEWFMKIEEKSKYKFIVHDIKLLPINKGNTTYQSNKLCRKTCKHNKRR